MARKKIRECAAKKLLRRHHKQLGGVFDPIEATASTNWGDLAAARPELKGKKFVVKPDMLFGQRGKNDLVALNIPFDEVGPFIAKRVNREVSVGEPPLTDTVTHFIVEEFIPHKEEYYISLTACREGTRCLLSPAGGVDVEENWDKVRTFDIGIGVNHNDVVFPEGFFDGFPAPVEPFVRECVRVFEDLDFTLLEMNPFCMAADGQSVIPLDMRGELDDQAAYKNQKKWGGVVFPKLFGRYSSKEEDFISELDSQTGASLKFTILNPKARVWLLVAGGGASVIFTDTVYDLGYGHTLGNYGEYSGNPTDEHTYQYAKTVLNVATRLDDECPEKGRVLLIGGGIANFTDVKATFRGICKALLEFGDRLQAVDMRLYVRRAGPNFEAALKMLKDIEAGIGVPVEVFGPETHMTKIVHLGTEYLTEYDRMNNTK